MKEIIKMAFNHPFIACMLMTTASGGVTSVISAIKGTKRDKPAVEITCKSKETTENT